jgi:AcrR family transcriptional regulator
MTLASPVSGAEPAQLDAPVRSRDAEHTRQQLLQAARRRFAFDGYDATTVRDIATDAGVNVALINRYFTSKEGLFEACITSAGEKLVHPPDASVTVDDLARKIVDQLADDSTDDDTARLQMLLLLRSSGDPRAETIRRTILRRYSEGMARAAGWQAGIADGESLVLRAQIALSTGLGIVLLRSSSDLEPLASASRDDLLEPMREVLAALLGKPDTA